MDRLIDAFESGLLEKSEFESRIVPLRAEHDRETASLASYRGQDDDATTAAAVATLEHLAEDVASNLATANHSLKRELFQLLLNRVEIHTDEIRIIYKAPTCPILPSLADFRRGKLHHCLLRQQVAPCVSVG